jgi:hypothetical protein
MSLFVCTIHVKLDYPERGVRNEQVIQHTWGNENNIKNYSRKPSEEERMRNMQAYKKGNMKMGLGEFVYLTVV